MANGVQIGYYRRAKVRLVPLKGYDPQNSRIPNLSRPVKSGVTILSGQIMQQLKNTGTGIYEWVLAGTASAVGVPAFALNDSTNYDVAASSLVGLPVDGDFELQTGYYKTGDAYTVGAKLTIDGSTGNIKVAVAGSAVIGEVSGHKDSPIDLAPAGSPALQENNTAISGLVVQLRTNGYGTVIPTP